MRALAAFTSASSSPAERHSTHNSGKNAGRATALLALALLSLLPPDRGKPYAAESGVRGVKEIVNPQRCVCCRWLAFSVGGLSWSLTRQQIRSCCAGERSEACSAIRLVELLQLFSAPSGVSLLDGCGVKHFSNEEALLWSLQHCFCLG